MPFMPNTGQDRPVETQVIHILPSPEFRAASVLVVDDELPALRLLRLMLSAPAFHCTRQAMGKKPLRLFSDRNSTLLSPIFVCPALAAWSFLLRLAVGILM